MMKSASALLDGALALSLAASSTSAAELVVLRQCTITSKSAGAAHSI